MLTIYVRTGEQFWRMRVTPVWAARHDNGALISCGLTVPADLTYRAWTAAQHRFRPVQVSRDEWAHSGCQSSCIRRGGKECRW